MRENAQRAATAVQTVLKALENEDAQLARAVIDGDTAIDLAENAIEEKCLDILALDGPVATDLRRVVTILKTNVQIERLGDLATNIAEDIVYLKTAETVRHERRRLRADRPYARALVRRAVNGVIRLAVQAVCSSPLRRETSLPTAQRPHEKSHLNGEPDSHL